MDLIASCLELNLSESKAEIEHKTHLIISIHLDERADNLIAHMNRSCYQINTKNITIVLCNINSFITSSIGKIGYLSFKSSATFVHAGSLEITSMGTLSASLLIVI